MNKLTHFKLQGFKTFRSLEFEPRSLNILIGANGVGKSNLLSFFRMTSWMMASAGQLSFYVEREDGAHKLLHDGAATEKLVAELTFVTDRGSIGYAFELDYAAGDRLVFAAEKFRFAENSGASVPWRSLGEGHRESRLIELAEQNDATARILRGLIQRCVVYQFHNTYRTSRMRGKWRAADNRYLKEDAANLAPVLLRLRSDAPLVYRRIVATLRLIVPFFDDFELNPDHDNLLLTWRERDSDVVFDAPQASDGMLRTFALVTLLGQPEAELPNILLLDEPELGLHPYAISIVAGMIARAAQYSQIFVATQSVMLLDQFTPEDIVVVERHGRASTLRRLQTETLTDWLAEYSLGELWLKNLLGGRPQR